MKISFSIYRITFICIFLGLGLCFSIFYLFSPFGNQNPPIDKSTVLVFSHSGVQIPIYVELARTPGEQERGLMYRKTLAGNAGMLFIFNTSEIESFWMKNTVIPLDIIFLDKNKKIVKIYKNAVPYDLTPLSSMIPIEYTVEVDAGFSDTNHIVPGDTVEFSLG